MKMNEPLIGQLKHEAAGTRKMLELSPADKYDWKPHEKSMTLGQLTAHLSELASWLNAAVEKDELDFATSKYEPRHFTNTEDLLKFFDETMEKGLASLHTASDENLRGLWKLRIGEKVFFEMTRIAVIRSMVISHTIHHRGQLSVYLRLLDVPLPSIYGPTADEAMM